MWLCNGGRITFDKEISGAAFCRSASRNDFGQVIHTRASTLLIITRKCGVVMRSVAYVCVSVFDVLTFESFDLESSFLLFRLVFGITRSSSQGQDQKCKKPRLKGNFVWYSKGNRGPDEKLVTAYRLHYH